MTPQTYRGRLAPTPTGYLHLGHAATFWVAQQRARAAGGKLVLRIEDIDISRCRPEFRDALFEDLRWLGFEWDEGPDAGGPFAPYKQSERGRWYLEALELLKKRRAVYPCTCSRRDVVGAAIAPHDDLAPSFASPLERRSGRRPPDEMLYPGTCRNRLGDGAPPQVNWRFRVPDGERLAFRDGRLGEQASIAGRDFGDFIVWRRDEVPAYQLAVVVDDAAMGITEVVRGEDLVTSTFRQLLLYRALDLTPPGFYHTPLMRDESGTRLAKRNASLSIRALRASGLSADEVRSRF